jgi:hypothetical protein
MIFYIDTFFKKKVVFSLIIINWLINTPVFLLISIKNA